MRESCRLWSAAKGAALQWVEHKDARLGAALSYYSVFSLGPLLLIAVAMAGLIFGREAVQGEVTGALRVLLGDSGAEAINAMLADAGRPHEGIGAIERYRTGDERELEMPLPGWSSGHDFTSSGAGCDDTP